MNLPAVACTHRGCGNAQPCETHKRSVDVPRGTYQGASSRQTYNRRWEKYREWFMGQVQCVECDRNHVLCEECQREGKATASFALDHIQPHIIGQASPKFWLHSNLQSLCEQHHNSKSRSERRW